MPLLLVAGGIALLVLLLLLSLFLVPVRALVAADWRQGRGHFFFQASWGFIGVRVRWEGWEIRVEYLFLGRPFHSTTRKDREFPAGNREGRKNFLAILTRIPVLLRLAGPVAGFGERFIRATRLQELRAKARVGLSDPASTGLMYGCYCALRPVIPRDRFSLQLSPVFDRQVFEGEILARLRIDRLLLLLIGATGLFLNPDVRRDISLLRGTGE